MTYRDIWNKYGQPIADYYTIYKDAVVAVLGILLVLSVLF